MPGTPLIFSFQKEKFLLIRLALPLNTITPTKKEHNVTSIIQFKLFSGDPVSHGIDDYLKLLYLPSNYEYSVTKVLLKFIRHQE